MVLIAWPLPFATLDEIVAAARGVPVRLLGYGFLALAGISAAEATQTVGSLLLLGLLRDSAAQGHDEDRRVAERPRRRRRPVQWNIWAPSGCCWSKPGRMRKVALAVVVVNRSSASESSM